MLNVSQLKRRFETGMVSVSDLVLLKEQGILTPDMVLQVIGVALAEPEVRDE